MLIGSSSLTSAASSLNSMMLPENGFPNNSVEVATPTSEIENDSVETIVPTPDAETGLTETVIPTSGAEEEHTETATPTPEEELTETATPTPEEEPLETVTPMPEENSNTTHKKGDGEIPLAENAEQKEAVPVVKYRAHVSKIGWQDYVENGSTAGTTGQKLPMEAFELSIDGTEDLGVEYRAHVSKIGWQDFVSDGSVSGTTGQKLGIEAIEIELTGESADQYDIWYRVHSDKLGWLGWTRNGSTAGSTGFGYCVQAFEVYVSAKNTAAPEKTDGAYLSKPSVHYKAHVSKIGWQSAVTDGAVAGTTGQKLPMEALEVTVSGAENLQIQYRAHVSKIGWQDYVSDGITAGTTGRKLSIEAVQLNLAGEAAKYFDVWYRVHSDKIGWMDWARNGEMAGTTGFAYGMQAIEIRIIPKQIGAPGSTGRAYLVKPSVSYRAHVSKLGWQDIVGSGTVAGTTGRKLPMEALEISTSGVENLGIQYRTHVSKLGWQDYVSNGMTAGTTGQKLAIEAVEIQLTGSAAQNYDIWYRVHSDQFGWLGWTKNGTTAGTTGFGYAAQAIQIVINVKGLAAPGSTVNAYVKNQEGWIYKDGYRRYRDKYGNIMNDVSSIFNPSSKYITVDRTRGLTTIYGYNSETGAYDTPIKAMICSVGNPISLTEVGIYNIGWQLQYKQMVGPGYICWAPYVSQIYGAVYFHGVASSTPDLQSVAKVDFNALGTPQSHGCVRLAACDAKWIYYNVDSGTTVRIGDNLSAPMTGVRYQWSGSDFGADPTYS